MCHELTCISLGDFAMPKNDGTHVEEAQDLQKHCIACLLKLSDVHALRVATCARIGLFNSLASQTLSFLACETVSQDQA